MNTIMLLVRRLTCSSLPAASLTGSFVAAVLVANMACSEELPAVVSDALKSNAASLSTVTIEWTERINSPLARDDLWKLTTLKSGNVAFFRPREYRYVRKGDRFFYHFKEYRQVPPEPAYVDWHDWACDGTSLYEFSKTAAGEQPGAQTYTPLFTVRKLSNVSGNDSTKNTPYIRCLYLQAVGFYVPTYGRELGKGPESLLLHLMQSGARVASVRNATVRETECLRVELQDEKRIYVFHLDPVKRYAVVQYEESARGGERLAVIVNSDFNEVGHSGLWLPKLAKSTWYAWHDWYNWVTPIDRRSDKPVVTVDMAATTLHETPAPDNQFAIDVHSTPPGTLVGDERLAGAEKRPNGRVSYVVPPDPKMLEEAARNAERWKSGPGGDGHRPILLIVNIALIVILLGIFILRRRRRRNA